MKITIPETPSKLLAQRRPDGTVADFSFSEFVGWLVDNDNRFTKDASALRSGKRIVEALAGTTAGDIRDIEAPDWRLLRDVSATPSHGYPVRPASLALAYIDAIEAAKGD